MNLADALIPRSYKDGECIIKQGEAADGMYFIEDGTIRICILDEANKEVEVRLLVIVFPSCGKADGYVVAQLT